jgi:hypothetical protein
MILMRRSRPKDSKKRIASIVDVKKDLSKDQLAAIGAVALAYNAMEDGIDRILFVVTGIQDWLFPEVSTRIHGLDGKVGIIYHALERAKLEPFDRECIKEALGLFKDFKQNRDAIIHSRIFDPSAGVGISEARRAQASEVLLSIEALGIFYDHIIALEKELSSAGRLLGSAMALSSLALADRNRAQYEEAVRDHQTQYRESQRQRLALKSMPKFPTERELLEVANLRASVQTAIVMGWFQEPPMPQRPSVPRWMAGTTVSDAPLPLKEEKK